MRDRADPGRGEVETLLGEWFAQEPREDVEAFLARHPRHATALREHLAMSDLLDRSLAERPAIPDRIGPFRVEGELGTGGMGTVYRAVVAEATRTVETGRTVAVKVVHPHLFRTPGFFKRFLREADLGRRIDHPNVVRTLDADAVEQDGRTQHFLVMEYVEGRTLRDLLEELDRVPEDLAVHVGREVVKALGAIHAAGAVHRDLKPENVLLTADHVVKVMDLGVARLADEQVRLSQTGAFVGSLQYAAPEQMLGGDAVDARADLHALGLLLYELTAGANPYADEDPRAAMRRILAEAPRRLGEVNPQVSPFFEEVVHNLLAKEPGRRFPSAAAVLEVLERREESDWWKVHAVAIRTATKRPLRRVRVPRETAVYGRDAELARLRELWDRAKSGEGRVVLVEGEAGIGKSRLVDEFVARLVAAGEDLNFLFGSYPPGGAATASGAFTTAYSEHLGEEGLEDALRQHLPVTPILVPAFAALLRGDAAPPGAEPLTKGSLQTVFVHCTRSFAAERPTVVAIDDLHFAPEEGRALFASLALAVPGHRILLVGTMRPGVPEAWTSGVTRLEHAVTLAVPRLGAKDLVRLLGDSFRSERLAEELAGKIALKSDGNPFFVFEIIRGLREGQFLRQRPDGTWETTRLIEDLTVPSSILDLVNARVADLDDADRNLLDVASCCGFEFDAGLVGDSLGMARVPVLQALAKVEKRHRLVRAAGHRFVFDHHQVQEALYGALPPPLREEYHAALGDALERRTGASEKDPEELDGATCVALCEHFLAGARGNRAVKYLTRAMGHLEASHLPARTLDLADRVLGISGLLTGLDRCAVLRRLYSGNCTLALLGMHERRLAFAQEAKVLADAEGDEAAALEAVSAVGMIYLSMSRLKESEAVLRRVLHTARRRRDERMLIRVHQSLGIILRRLGRTESARHRIEQALTVARRIGDLEGVIGNTINQGGNAIFCDRYDEARTLTESGLAMARSAGHRLFEANALGNLSIILLRLGEPQASLKCAQEGACVRRAIGDRAGAARAQAQLVVPLLLLGQPAAARAAAEESLRISGELGDLESQLEANNEMGMASSHSGLLRDALEHRRTAATLARTMGSVGSECAALNELGAVLIALGRIEAAGESFTRARTIANSHGFRLFESTALAGLADVHWQQGDAAGAVANHESALRIRRDLHAREHVAESLINLARIHLDAGSKDRAARAVSELGESPSQWAAVAVVVACVCAATCVDSAPPVERAEAMLASDPDRFDQGMRMWAHLCLWRVARRGQHLAAARTLLDERLGNAPPEDRESMLTNVRLNREIAAEWAEHGGEVGASARAIAAD